jgi:hypothetical protein
LCDRVELLRGRLVRLAVRERVPLLRAWLPFEDLPLPPLDLVAPKAAGTIPPRASINAHDSTHFSNGIRMHCSAARAVNIAIENCGIE